MTSHAGSPFYALYVQATRVNNDGSTSRKQWMVFPPFPEKHARQFKLDAATDMLLFSRSQDTLENRVKWKHAWFPPAMLERDIDEKLNQLRALNKNYDSPANHWKISPVLVAQVTSAEMAGLVRNPTTPYFALKRFEKIASKRHGFAI